MQFLKDVWTAIYEFAVNNFHSILLFLVVLIVGFVATKIVMRILKRIVKRSHLNGTAGNFLLSLAKTAIAALYIIILLSMLGVDTTSLVAIFSVLTLAISLAVQDVIANLASGITLIVTKPFEEGNFVDIDGSAGTVEKIHITCTKLRTTDNKIITIPNGSVSSAKIINYSAKPTRRVDLTFSAAYGSDIELLKSIILGVIQKHELILTD
ncbi:MAG: mechanosensitive ion channel, partial [Clostridia bacterium]|nr:mechanosensitive ion channel [Clostridia bacterium]